MSPQLTLQTPLQLPSEEIPLYLEKLWASDQPGNLGSNTFCLLIWQPAWLEQQLVRTGRIRGPVIGSLRKGLIEAARTVVLEKDLPPSTSSFDAVVTEKIANEEGEALFEDLRGQHIDSSISALQPRRLITLAPTIDDDHQLETLVAAYCPLPEEGGGQTACGDVVVLKGGIKSLIDGLDLLTTLAVQELPSWLWWNGNLDEASNLLEELATSPRRIIIDTALGDPKCCLFFLNQRILQGQAVNDLNWLRLRSWRETLAIVFDPPERRNALENVIQLDIDIEDSHPVQGLLFASWLADRLDWTFTKVTQSKTDELSAQFVRLDGTTVRFHLMYLPVANPSNHPGQIVGIRLISKSLDRSDDSICVILGAESGECMRLEAGGMASMELVEEVVPIQRSSLELDVSRLLASSRGSTSPLLEAAAPISSKIYNEFIKELSSSKN